ncbi:MAG TPA: ribosome-binding factor A, partial [Intrasporangium sp.]|nr:ribosome-binding factor A [Intrasporangium sp.]
EGAAHLEDLVAQTRARDEELARAAANARHAGEPDPYKKPVDRDVSDEVDLDINQDVDVEAR